MRSTIATVLLSTGAFLATGCDNGVPQIVTASPDGPEFTGPAPTLTTDQSAYVAVGDSGIVYDRLWHFTVIATLRNDSDQRLYIDGCGGPRPVYGFDSYSAGSAYAPVYGCSGSGVGIAVLPHATRIDTLQIVGPNSFDGHTGVGFGSLSGTLALSYALATCTDVGACHAGTIAAISAPFIVSALP